MWIVVNIRTCDDALDIRSGMCDSADIKSVSTSLNKHTETKGLCNC